jgi:hypothetical protein
MGHVQRALEKNAVFDEGLVSPRVKEAALPQPARFCLRKNENTVLKCLAGALAAGGIQMQLAFLATLDPRELSSCKMQPLYGG